MKNISRIFLIFSFLIIADSINFAHANNDKLAEEIRDAVRVGRKYLNYNYDFAPHEIEKCFTDGLLTIAQNWDRLSPDHQKEFATIFARPGVPGTSYGSLNLPDKFETPHFRLHYIKTGRHAPPLEDFHPRNGVPDYVDVCADALEKSYRIEVQTMNYKAPLDDFWALYNGGNQKEDVYLFMFGALGLTTADWYNGRVLTAAQTFGPYYMINSRMWDFYGKSEGTRYIETTVAHEYFHGVQFGYNNKMPAWFMEASATWMESKVYDGGREVFDIDPKYIDELDQAILPIELAKLLDEKHKIFLLDRSKTVLRDGVEVLIMEEGFRWRIWDSTPIKFDAENNQNKPIQIDGKTDYTKRRIYEIRKFRDRLLFHEDFDSIPESDHIGETDGYHYFTGQLQGWFLIPDISLDDKQGNHEYGSMIWVFYLTERFGEDIVRKYYASTTTGASREYGNFARLFEDHGTTLAEVFKTFTVWNYFTADRDDGRHYFNGNRFVSVAINPEDVHDSYPIRVHYDDKQIPSAFGTRYVVFDPPKNGEILEDFAVRIDGTDLAPIDMNTVQPDRRDAIQGELKRVASTGLRGWGAKFIVHKSDGSTEEREMLTYHRSQEAQIIFHDFGGEVTKIAMALINIHPDVEQVITPDYDPRTGVGSTGGEITYFAGVPPKGKLIAPKVKKGETHGVHVEWGLEDLSGIKEVVIVRKRFESRLGTDTLKPFQSEAEVLNAIDRDLNGVPDGDINIVGRVSATETYFFDETTFQDTNVLHARFNPRGVAYYYAVVPFSDRGLMGTPAIGQGRAVPIFNPEIDWRTNGSTPTAAAPSITKLLQSYPNPFNPETWIPFELAKDSPVKIEIYSARGDLIRIIDLGRQRKGNYTSRNRAAYWDGRNELGDRVASGVYFYVLKSDNFVGTRKMVVVK